MEKFSMKTDGFEIKGKAKNGKVKIARLDRSFLSRIIQNQKAKGYYNDIKNYCLSFERVKVRPSWGAESFQVGSEAVVKLIVFGGCLCVLCALSPSDYPQKDYPHIDFSDKREHSNTPLMTPVRNAAEYKLARRFLGDAFTSHCVYTMDDAAWVDYISSLPNEKDEALIKKGLIKVTESEASEPDAKKGLAAALQAEAEEEKLLEKVGKKRTVKKADLDVEESIEVPSKADDTLPEAILAMETEAKESPVKDPIQEERKPLIEETPAPISQDAEQITAEQAPAEEIPEEQMIPEEIITEQVIPEETPAEQEEPEGIAEEVIEDSAEQEDEIEDVVFEFADDEEEDKEEDDVEDVIFELSDEQEEDVEEVVFELAESEKEGEIPQGVDLPEEEKLVKLRKYVKGFVAKMRQGSEERKDYYAAIKAALLSYKGVKVLDSFSGESFRKGLKTLLKSRIRGKTLCLFFALDTDNYKQTVYRQQYKGDTKAYAATPMMVKVKSEQGLKRALRLVTELESVCELQAGSAVDPDEIRKDYLFEETAALVEKGFVKSRLVTVTQEEADRLLKKQEK